MMELIKEGDDVLLFLDQRKTYLVRVESDRIFHTHKGFVAIGNLIGEPYGLPIKSSLGFTFYALKPLIRDRILKTARRTQVMYPKDTSYVIFMTGISNGSRVVEAGTGSGALTCALANAVKDSGIVYSYDVRSDFQNVAYLNLARAHLDAYVNLKIGDVTESIDEEDLDAVVLDLATPWLVIPLAYTALKGGGVFASFSPTMKQVIKTVSALKENHFIEIETVELVLKKTRLIDKQPSLNPFTGYITTARKVLEPE